MKNLTKPKEEPTTEQKPEKVLPPESPEEKAKRLRKESRRHLRVSFKDANELTEVRYFTHDPEEEDGHDASQMRDVADVGGEGRMFKQQQMLMDEDDEDEISEQDEKSLIAFREPPLIDFSDIDDGERERNYVKCGGGKLDAESAERSVRDYYEANNLIVVYTSPEDIPPNPREPADPYNGEPVTTVGKFALPPEKFAARARSRRPVQQQHNNWYGAQQPQHMPPSQPFDMSGLNGIINPQPQAQAPQQPQVDIQSILNSLKGVAPAQPTPPPQPQMGGGYPNAFQPPMLHNMQQQPPPTQQPPQQAPAEFDIASLLAKINPQINAAALPAMGGGSGGFASAAPPMGFGQQNAGGSYGNNNSNKTNDGRHHRAYRTKVCQFWLQGKCQKGEACSYKHTE